MALSPAKSKKKATDYGIQEDAFDLVTHMQRLLDTVVGIYEQQGIPLPTRRYWMVGNPPEDCEQVVVSLVQMYLGLPGDAAAEIQKCDAPLTVVANIHISREYPISESAQSPEQIMNAATWSAIDHLTLMRSMKEFDKDEFGFAGMGAIATVLAREPKGGIQTTVLNISTAVTG